MSAQLFWLHEEVLSEASDSDASRGGLQVPIRV